MGRPVWGYLGIRLADSACIQLCGDLTVEIDGRRCESGLPGRQGRLLLAYLVVHRMRPVGRDELVDALWPEFPPAAPYAGLSALLSKLRRLLGPAVLQGLEALRLDLPPGARVDVEQAVEAIHRAESAITTGDFDGAMGPSLAARYITERGFLPGHCAPWIEAQRRELDEIMLRALECTAICGVHTGGTEFAAAERAARRLVALAPFRETGYRRLMDVLVAVGNVAEAVRVYDELRCRLRDELGTAPSPPLQEDYLRLLRTGAPA